MALFEHLKKACAGDVLAQYFRIAANIEDRLALGACLQCIGGKDFGESFTGDTGDTVVRFEILELQERLSICGHTQFLDHPGRFDGKS